MRFNPIVGFLFAVVVLLIWLYQGFSGPDPRQTTAQDKPRQAAPEGLALVAAGDRHGSGAAAALVAVLDTLDEGETLRVTYLDRVTPEEAPRVIGRLAREDWSLILVEGDGLRTAAQAVAEARPGTRLALATAEGPTKASGRLSTLGFRDWEAGALGGVAAALASTTGKVGFLDLGPGLAAGQSFEKGAHSAVSTIETHVARPPPGSSVAGAGAEARALLSGLLAQGVDVVLARVDDTVLRALVEHGGSDAVRLIAWRPWGRSEPSAWGGDEVVIGRLIQRPEKLVAALVAAEDNAARTVTLGLAEGAQDLEIREGVLDAAILDRLNTYRDGLAREGLKDGGQAPE
jgi:basic membrane lipoprotein Med (substrate-binding protein (PBP1-ABC) superfamily)